jgi:hypothetical protein
MQQIKSMSQKQMSLAAITMMAMLALMTPAILIFTPEADAVSSKNKVITRGQGIGGSATWTNDISVEVPGVGTIRRAEIFVTESEGTGIEGKITDILVSFITEEGNSGAGFTTIVDQNVFDANNRLTSATLSPVTLEASVFDEFGNIIETTEITVQATWEGTGDLNKSKFSQHSKSDEFDFSVKFRHDTLSREEFSAEGSINNANLGTTDLAEFFTFKDVNMEVSKSIIS